MSAIPQSEPLIVSENGLVVSREQDGDGVTVVVGTNGQADGVLHWGLARAAGAPWLRPPKALWPAGTAATEGPAVRTPFTVNDRGERQVVLRFPVPCPERRVAFVLHYPKENRWVKRGGGDYVIDLPGEQGRGQDPEQALAEALPDGDVRRAVFHLDGEARLAAAVRLTPETVRVALACDAAGPLVLHWGVAWLSRLDWQLPPEELRPAGSSVFDRQAVRSSFVERDGLRWLEWEWRRAAGERTPRGLRVVLFQPETGTWLKSDGKELYLAIDEQQKEPRLPSAKLEEIADAIVGAEMGAGSWTLMHRFNLCHDLLAGAQDDPETLALLFAWLRYSATRHLDWQRRFNTKPRELAHAQDRLTQRLAGVWRSHPSEASGATSCRLWARLMLTTLGPGGDGQRVRDEILQIMHRNHVKEVGGHFLEEWHQKLHNNTTPDDVVICEAYLAFMHSNGDRAVFYRTLERGGVTRERLQSFERPIRSEPNFLGDRRNALLGEFEHFLRILKAVHAGTDLDSAVGAARGRLDGGLNRKLDALLSRRSKQPSAGEVADAVVSLRSDLAHVMVGTKDDAALRDLLFLDLALAETLRGAIERASLSKLSPAELTNLVHAAVRNLVLTAEGRELSLCAAHWSALLAKPQEGREGALHAKSVADRTGRWVQEFTDGVYRLLQPRAEYLGETFGVEKWVVTLFSEEVVRGGPAFALSLLLRHLDKVLRGAAGLGGWQVISPAPSFGRLRVVDRLLAVQGERFPEATVIVADIVAGNEEIPEGVTAVLTADSPDLVSHVAVRARNAHVLLATCYDAETYQSLKKLKDHTLALSVTPSGDVSYTEANPEQPKESSRTSPVALSSCHPVTLSSSWVLAADQFAPGVVGGKSNNLNGLRGRLPDRIQLPTSLALPFGVYEKVLDDSANRDLRREQDALVAAAEAQPAEVLPRLRQLLLNLKVPTALQTSLQEAWQRTRLPAVNWDHAWNAIRRVWASKWNERAFLSRRARGMPHDSLRMAVLIQQVVEADYAFVIHTVNPITGNRDELFAEVVLGLGETLVGNYPGRALGFVCRKSDLSAELLSYPGKSVGLYGKGVIFRSDSSGEDLEGFAGAGLYDSYLAEEPDHRVLDYTNERLVWDRGFRDDLLRAIARIGLAVEGKLGSAQDIEGAVAGDQYYVVQTRPQVGLSV